MYEFKWTLPGDAKQTVTLQIASRSSWNGRKTLWLGNRIVYRRGRMEGIEHSFRETAEGRTLHLTWEPLPDSCRWRAVLLCEGTELEEITGCPPPPVPKRPRFLAVVTGITCLTMFMTAIMLPHIWRMLHAGLGHSDNRGFVLTVEHHKPGDGLRLRRDPLPPAAVGQPYQATIGIEGGKPPYVLTCTQGRMPQGLTFDKSIGRIHGTPRETGDIIIGVGVTDAQNSTAKWSYVLSVRPEEPPPPRIVTRLLPAAREQEPYRAELQVVGGKPPYHWVINKRKLPKGLEFKCDSETSGEQGSRAVLTGTPEPNLEGKIKNIDDDARQIILNGTTVQITEGTILRTQGQTIAFDDLSVGQTLAVGGVTDRAYPIRLRVYDSTYSPSQGVFPWVVPFAVTTICLLGFWNMRRWGVVLYGVLILGQMGLGYVTEYPLSWVAIILQMLVFSAGAASFSRMQ